MQTIGNAIPSVTPLIPGTPSGRASAQTAVNNPPPVMVEHSTFQPALGNWAVSGNNLYETEGRVVVVNKILTAINNGGTELTLAGLQFGPELPPILGQLLPELKVLDLSGSSVTKLSDELLNDLTHLEALGIGRTNISEFPTGILKLSQLKTLSIASTPIYQLPEDINKLSQLEVLSARNTPLTRLPNAIGSLPLTYLNLSETHIETLPSSIAQLGDTLISLSLAGTPFKKISPEMAQLEKLQYLDLASTQIISLEIRTAQQGTLKEVYGKLLPEDPEVLSQMIMNAYSSKPKSLLLSLPNLKTLGIAGTPFASFLAEPGMPLVPNAPLTNHLFCRYPQCDALAH